MIVGNRNDKSLTYEMDNGVSNLELSKVTDGLSNSQVDDLIDTLCKVRNENPDTVIMDEIKKGNNPPINPIELEKINEQREYDSVEMEIIENMIDSGDMSIEEMNMMKANGFYDRYTKYKESKGVLSELSYAIGKNIEIINYEYVKNIQSVKNIIIQDNIIFS